MIICPSCGLKVDCDLCVGCPSCGARAVGPPLARAEHELPSYSRAVIVSGSGLAMSGVFLASVIAALVEFGVFPPRFGSIINAGEVAAWRMKWVALPVALIVLWSSARIVRSINANPTKFIGLRAARLGIVSSALVTLMIATLIGVTVPVRLERRQWAIDAATYARGHTLDRALLEYRELKGTFPTDIKELGDKSILPDADGSIAEALSFVDPNGYNPSTVLAAASTKSKPLTQRGSAIRKTGAGAELATDHGGVSFTSYDLRLPGEDKMLNTDDDFVVHDGLIKKASELPASSALTRPNTP